MDLGVSGTLQRFHFPISWLVPQKDEKRGKGQTVSHVENGRKGRACGGIPMVRDRRTLQNKLAMIRKMLCSTEEGALWDLCSPIAPGGPQVTPSSDTANDKKPSGRSHRARPGQGSSEHRASETADTEGGTQAQAAEDRHQQCHCPHISSGTAGEKGFLLPQQTKLEHGIGDQCGLCHMVLKLTHSVILVAKDQSSC